MSDIHRTLPTEALTALQNGSKIEAIKHVREAHGIGLKEAKEVVEAYIDTNPDMKRQMSTANAESARGCLGWAALVGLAAIAAWYWYSGGR